MDEEAFNYLSKQLNKKEPSLERKLSKEMSRMIAGFAFSWSKWNNQQYNQNQFVFQVKEPDAEEVGTLLNTQLTTAVAHMSVPRTKLLLSQGHGVRFEVQRRLD